MQKRDYILISGALRNALADCGDRNGCRVGVGLAARYIANEIRKHKAQFDTARFYSDIGL
jgi:hypothetical protein